MPADAALPQAGDGVARIGNRLWFYRRNDEESATFDFGLLAERGWVSEDKAIHFVAGEIPVATLTVPATLTADAGYGELAFVGQDETAGAGLMSVTAAGTTLKSVPKKNGKSALEETGVFVVTASVGQTRSFRGIAFAGADAPAEGEEDAATHDGGAIMMTGGAIEVKDCAFDGCRTGDAGQFGGAICAVGLTGDSLVTNATFRNCRIGTEDSNGNGGAIYATAASAVNFAVVDSVFESNWAQKGGAISTSRDRDGTETAIRLVLKNDAFVGNTAVYEGGAIRAGGDVVVLDAGEDDATVFEDNFAGWYGGAIALDCEFGSARAAAVSIGSNTLFSCNVVSNDNSDVAYGGAIAMMLPIAGCTLDVVGATFADNVAYCGGNADGCGANGGAIFSLHSAWTNDVPVVFDFTNRITKTAFYGNVAAACSEAAGDDYARGGAVMGIGGHMIIDNCVFGGNDAIAHDDDAWRFGGALEIEGDLEPVGLTVLNSTFRHSNVEAVSAYLANVGITNCVIVGNGEETEGVDLVLENCEASLAYCAYGARVGEAAGERNLPGRTTEIYAGDTLRLDETGFNPVAAFGLAQPGVTDFDGVGYGSRPVGSAMGAYEAATEMLTVRVEGNRRYDGSNSATGIAEFAWSVVDADGEEVEVADIDDITNLFEVEAWEFASADVGAYAGTNGTDGTIAFALGVKEGPFDFYANAFVRVAKGKILPRPVQFESASAEKVYDTMPLTANEADDAWDCSGTRLADDAPCGLVDGETVGFDITGSRTESGVSPNEFTVVWGSVWSGNYDVKTNVCGVLEVLPRPVRDLEVGPTNVVYTYGGTNLCPQVYVTLTNDLGEVISNLVIGVDFAVDYTNNVNAFDTPYYVVTPSSNFTGTVTNEFTIKPRPVTFTSASASKAYDGKPLVTNKVTWTQQDVEGPGTGILTREEKYLAFDVTGSQTKMGESENTFSVIWNEPGIISSNYVATLVFGRLAVTVRENGDLEIRVLPDEYAWTGDYVKATTIEVWDRSIGELIPETEYDVYYDNNLPVTDSAFVTVALKPGSAWTGRAQTNFWITAYLVEYFLDGERFGPTERHGAISGSNAVAAVSVPEGYCLDWQNSLTNGVVTRYDGKQEEGKRMLKLVVLYERDVNGDKVPDKYQKKLLFKVVNGFWNDNSLDAGTHGTDVELWKTLFGPDGRWSADGTARLNEADRPAVGARPASGYAKNVGKWCPPLSSQISMSSFPFFLYDYGTGQSSGTGRVKPGSGSSIARELSAVVRIVSFERTLGAITLGARAAVVDKATGSTIDEEPLYGTKVIIEVSDDLGGEWKPADAVVTDGEGRATSTRTNGGSARFFRERIVGE